MDPEPHRTVQAFDGNDAPLGNAVTWVDRRGRDELNGFVERLGGLDRVAALLGIDADPVLSAATILRWRADLDCPQHGAVRFAGPQATVIQRLTSMWATDESHAPHYGLAALGAGVMASMAIGCDPDVRTAAARMTGVLETLEPRPSTSTLYDALYARYRKITELVRQAPVSS